MKGNVDGQGLQDGRVVRVRASSCTICFPLHCPQGQTPIFKVNISEISKMDTPNVTQTVPESRVEKPAHHFYEAGML